MLSLNQKDFLLCGQLLGRNKTYVSVGNHRGGTASQREAPADPYVLALYSTDRTLRDSGRPPRGPEDRLCSLHTKAIVCRGRRFLTVPGLVLVGLAPTSSRPTLPGCLRGGGAGVTDPGSLPAGPLGTCEATATGERWCTALSPPLGRPHHMGPLSCQINTAKAARIHSCHCLPHRLQVVIKFNSLIILLINI